MFRQKQITFTNSGEGSGTDSVFGTKYVTVLVSFAGFHTIYCCIRFRWYLSVLYGMIGAYFDVFRRAIDRLVILVTSCLDIYYVDEIYGFL